MKTAEFKSPGEISDFIDALEIQRAEEVERIMAIGQKVTDADLQRLVLLRDAIASVEGAKAYVKMRFN